MPQLGDLLRLRGISKAYPGVVANDHITLTLARGEIHALVGENGAGKSTLMGILYGLVRPDAGEVTVDGTPVDIAGPRDAMGLGIGYVQQHFSLIPTLTAAENLVLALRGSSGKVKATQARVLLQRLASRHGLPVEPDVPVEQLPVAQQQRAEVLKALAREVRILALDEPNALLTPEEWRQLAAVLRGLADNGVGVLLISHKLSDVLDLADRVTVLRAGRVVATRRATEVDAQALGALMVGELRQPGTAQAPAEREPGDTRLEVSDLWVDGSEGPAVRGVSLRVRAGEIVGLAGVEGSGQVELTEALVGLRPVTGGSVVHDGGDVTRAPVATRLHTGIGYVPADRLGAGLVSAMSVTENLLLPRIGQRAFSRWGFTSGRALTRRARELVAAFDIRVPDPSVPVAELSGGNQQKVVLARELSRDPDVLVGCYPTRGLDFAATEAVRDRLLAARREGAAILFASVDLDELLAISDRIVILHAGEVTGEVEAAETTPELLGTLMGGGQAA